MFDLGEVGIQRSGVQEPGGIDCEVEETAADFTPLNMQGQMHRDVGGGVAEKQGHGGQGSSVISEFDVGIYDVPSSTISELDDVGISDVQGNSAIGELGRVGTLEVSPSASAGESFLISNTTRPSVQENVIPATWLTGLRTTILAIICDIPGI